MTMKELEARLVALEAGLLALADASGHSGVVNDAMTPAESDEASDNASAQAESVSSE